MVLIDYKKKRDFKKTKEPIPLTKNSLRKNKEKFNLIYMIHEHHASHLHWDLRLEKEGILKSWAVPKTPPTTKEIKRLAIQVEDHPIEYAKFQGIIPEGNYGAGKVEIWDKGNYNLIEENKNKIIIDINGKKLKGKYCLIKTDYGNNKNSWLFFKLE